MPGLARRNLDTVLAAVLQASAGEESQEEEPKEEWTEALQRLSESSRNLYRELVHENEDFYTFWGVADRRARAVEHREPAKRVENPDVESLHAIPWVFAWAQNRFLLPSWYGAGTVLSSCAKDAEGRLDLLRKMYRGWPSSGRSAILCR